MGPVDERERGESGGTSLTSEERRLRFVLRASAFIFGAETLVYLIPALLSRSEPEWVQLPFVANSWVKAGLISGLCWVCAADLRRYERLVTLIVLALGLWVPAGIAFLIWGDTSPEYTLLGVNLSITAIVSLGIAFEGGLALLFAGLHRSALKARWGLRYLSPGQFRTLAAVTEALLAARPRDLPVSPTRAARNVDRYLERFEARRKWVMKVALTGISLYPLLFLRPSLSLMDPLSRRLFLERRFGDDVAARRIGELRRWLVQGMVRLAMTATYLGYYGDSRSHAEVGYVRFSRRSRYEEDMRRVTPHDQRDRLQALGPADVRTDRIESEVVVVGSGAAGALIGYRLAEAGRRVLVLERGRHVDPATFSEDEVEMFSRLYRDGAFQLARDFRLQVLQGMCVGGTTVINNAVCVEPHPATLERWAAAGVDTEALLAGVGRARDLLDIQPQPDEYPPLQPGARKFVEGIAVLGLGDQARRFGPVEANISDCLGCGYCNIGCRFGKKLSALDTLLPWAQRDFGDRLRVLAECEAEGIEASNGRATAVSCRLSDGRRLRVTGERIVVAAGAINSSYLLGRSGIGGASVGRGLCFNVGSPMTAEFDEELNSYDGLQITHLFEPAGEPRFVMETWFNPVVSQALTMPGWFEDHRRNMASYSRMTATGVLVGTESNGRVTKALFGGADIVWKPTDRDLAKLVEGLKLVGRIYLAAGAERVMPSTFRFHSFSRSEDLDRLDDIVRDGSDIQLGTGHPQGGNALSSSAEHGVVDPETFRVHGKDNLYLCDASAFPTSLTVNPQLTVLGLAECAAGRIADG